MKHNIRRAESRSPRKRSNVWMGAAAAAAVLCIAIGSTVAWATDQNTVKASPASASGTHQSGTETGTHSSWNGQAATPVAAPPAAVPAPITPTTPITPTAPITTPALAEAPTPVPAPAPAPESALHTNIVSTTFWVGEIFDADLSDGSQVCSTYDGQWALNHTGVELGTTPASASGCAGSVYGGCDGVSSGTGTDFACATESRDASNGYFPTSAPTPLQNPFYLDLPYDDVNDSTAFAERCQVVPWAASDNAATGVDHCTDSNYSYMKNRWVEITGPNGNTCYGQIQDGGPSSGSAYHDSNYVFGDADARPANTDFSGDSSQGAGTDVSPALNGCMGFAELDGDSDHVNWRFVDRANVPAGPWLTVETTDQVTG